MNVTPNLHISKVVFFSSGIKGEWSNPEPAKPNTRHVIVVIDVSGSMCAHKDELRVALSFIKALAGMPAIPLVPNPTGKTDLLGALQHCIAAPAAPIVVADDTRPQVLVFTDGYDNKQKITELNVGWDAEGKPRAEPIQKPEEGEDRHLRRQRLILEHATEYLGAHIALIGIGKQVSELLKLASKLPITVGSIQPLAPDATEADRAERVRDVCAVIHKVATRPRAAKPTAGKRTVITSTAPRPTKRSAEEIDDIAKLVPTETVVEVNKVAQTIVVSSQQSLTTDQWREALQICELKLDLHPDSSIREEQRDALWKKKRWLLMFTRAALLWFLEESHYKKEALAGAILGGDKTTIMLPNFKTQYPSWKSTMNKLLSALKGSNKEDESSVALLSVESAGQDADGKPEPWSYKHPALGEKPLNYKGVARYAPKSYTEDAIRHLFDNRTDDKGNAWALSRDEFLKYTKLTNPGESSEPPAKRAKQ